MIVALALSPSVDVTYLVDELTRGGITRPTRIVRVPGGKALNAARVAKALGATVHVIAALGGATGAWIRDALHEEGITCTTTELREATRSCISVVETGTDSPVSTDIYELASAFAADEWAAFCGSVHQAVTPGSIVAICGSTPDGVPLDELAALLAGLRAAGSTIVVDSSGIGLRAMIGSADLVKINITEAAEILTVQPTDALDACRLLRQRFAVDAVVTDGIKGASASVAGVECVVAGPRQLGRFPAGSGDAFLGGLVTGLARGDSLVDSLALAADAGERNALVAGQARLGESTRRVAVPPFRRVAGETSTNQAAKPQASATLRGRG